MSQVKSRAAKLLEKMNMKEDESPAGDIVPVNPDLPDDKAAAAAADQPTDNKTDAPSLQEELINDPDKMAGCLAVQESMCDKYMDEEDSSCYTPQGEEEKVAVSEAKMHLRNARSSMLKIKKKK